MNIYQILMLAVLAIPAIYFLHKYSFQGFYENDVESFLHLASFIYLAAIFAVAVVALFDWLGTL